MWDEIAYFILEQSLGMDKWFHLTFHNACNYLSMLGLKLIHVNKGTCHCGAAMHQSVNALFTKL